MKLDTSPTSKLSLLSALSAIVTQWPGTRPPNRSVCKAIREYFSLLAICDLSQLELWKLRACEYCLRQALDREPRHWVRTAWLMEIYNWQLLVESGAGRDSKPDLPPRNRVYEQALVSHQMLHPNVPLRPF